MSMMKDYKSTVTEGKVSVERLRSLLDRVAYDLAQLDKRVDDARMELQALIEEIGEKW